MLHHSVCDPPPPLLELCEHHTDIMHINILITYSDYTRHSLCEENDIVI